MAVPGSDDIEDSLSGLDDIEDSDDSEDSDGMDSDYVLENYLDLPVWWDDFGLKEALWNDDKQLFVRVLENKLEDMFRSSGSSTHQKLLHRLLWERTPVKCVEGVITGSTPLTVDLNLPCTGYGVYPIHVAAYFFEPSMIEMLLYYGARTDFKLPSDFHYEPYRGLLPLQLALDKLARDTYEEYLDKDWEPKQSMCKFLKFLLPLCLPINQTELECIALLAGKTKDTNDIFLQYAMQGKIVEFAALLLVAHKKVYRVMDRVHEHFLSSEQEYKLTEEMVHMRELIKVFDGAGDEISAYVKQDRCDVNNWNTSRDVLRFIQLAGFNILASDVDLNHFMDLLGKGCPDPKLYRCVDDFDMAHYSKSGYRWKVSLNDPGLKFGNPQAYINELNRKIEALKEESINIKRQLQEPKSSIWMEDDLRDALDKDDKGKFLSAIGREVDLLCSRRQELLYAVCESGSIKCAEALINGETPLTVDLNLPCTDTGMYPLHCATLLFSPSITELFLYNGARTDVTFTPCNLPDDFPKHLLEAYAGKRPLHIALLGISCLPCIREWTPEQSIIKLLTLFCLPRMQNALETLHLLVDDSKETLDNISQFAIDGKIVEVTALLIAWQYYDYNALAYKIRDLDVFPRVLSSDHRYKVLELLVKVFKDVGAELHDYIKEDKYNVSKHQVSEDLLCLFKEAGYPVCPSDTDLSLYNWYQHEELSYPSKAPYENVRLTHDIGMEHYGKFRYANFWEVTKEYPSWRGLVDQDNIKKMENELECLQKENAKTKVQLKQHLKNATLSVPYVMHHGVPVAASRLLPYNYVKAEAENKLIVTNSRNSFSTMTMSSTTSIGNYWTKAMSNKLHIIPYKVSTRTTVSSPSRLYSWNLPPRRMGMASLGSLGCI